MASSTDIYVDSPISSGGKMPYFSQKYAMNLLMYLALCFVMWMAGMVVDILALQRKIQADVDHLKIVKDRFLLFLKNDHRQSQELRKKLLNL